MNISKVECTETIFLPVPFFIKGREIDELTAKLDAELWIFLNSRDLIVLTAL